MPGDDLLPRAPFRATRAVTIEAPPEAVWPWLAQIGFGRAGFYSYDLLDNLGRPSAEEIVARHQALAVGDLAAPMASPANSQNSFRVFGFEPNRWLGWSKPGSTWVWKLTPVDGGTRCRLVVRLAESYLLPAALASAPLLEIADFPMMRKQLLGIKRRAEQSMASAPEGGSIEAPVGTVALYWIPLGSGQHVVRISGRAFEALSALRQRRRPLDLYHSALAVTVPEGRFVIEMTPVPDGNGAARGVVAEGPVGTRWAGRLRLFRYEIRCWPGGLIPDVGDATATVLAVIDMAVARRLLAVVPAVPTPVWGRDELRTGEMWNSNAVVSWVLDQAGVDVSQIARPPGGRAPGWDAGLRVAARQP
jgi:hypothetical protein